MARGGLPWTPSGCMCEDHRKRVCILPRTSVQELAGVGWSRQPWVVLYCSAKMLSVEFLCGKVTVLHFVMREVIFEGRSLRLD